MMGREEIEQVEEVKNRLKGEENKSQEVKKGKETKKRAETVQGQEKSNG